MLSSMNATSRKREDGEGPSKGLGCSLVFKCLSPGISRVWQTARKQSGGGRENIGKYVKNAERRCQGLGLKPEQKLAARSLLQV